MSLKSEEEKIKGLQWLNLPNLAIPTMDTETGQGILLSIIHLGFFEISTNLASELGIASAPVDGRVILPTVTVEYGESLTDYKLPIDYSGWVYKILEQGKTKFPIKVEFGQKEGRFYAKQF